MIVGAPPAQPLAPPLGGQMAYSELARALMSAAPNFGPPGGGGLGGAVPPLSSLMAMGKSPPSYGLSNFLADKLGLGATGGAQQAQQGQIGGY